jgi:hypothetical protein
MDAWYFDLADKAVTLPPPGGSHLSWFVDVYVRPVGHLGTYRRSTTTGLWYSGQHGIHMQGNP